MVSGLLVSAVGIASGPKSGAFAMTGQKGIAPTGNVGGARSGAVAMSIRAPFPDRTGGSDLDLAHLHLRQPATMPRRPQ